MSLDVFVASAGGLIMLLMSEDGSPNWHDYTAIFCVLIWLSLTVLLVAQKLLNDTKL